MSKKTISTNRLAIDSAVLLPSIFFFSATMLNIGAFMLSIKMHERYIFPTIALLMVSYILTNDKRLKYLYFGFSFAAFVNNVDVLNMSLQKYNYDMIKYTAVIFSSLTVVAFLYSVYTAFKLYETNLVEQELAHAVRPEPFVRPALPSDPCFDNEKIKLKSNHCTFLDFVNLGCILVVYGIVAFLNLGNTQSPQTMWKPQKGEVVVLDYGKTLSISRLQYLLGARHDQVLLVDFSTDNVHWGQTKEIKMQSVFSWAETELNLDARYVRFTVESNEMMLAELALRSKDNTLLPLPIIFSPSQNSTAKNLFDEQNLVPIRRDYMNSTYFDEVYHPRTAYEFVENLYVYEYTHPPLGKLIISVGIRLFGMTPFGWRFAGTLFGVLMLPFLYFFSKKMFQSSFFAAFATTIFAFDFMHYVQTRLATIDTYITFFVILMYYFMFQYYQSNFFKTKLWKTLVPLFFSGLFMGIGIACKWPGVYAGVGLAVIFFATLWDRYKEAKTNPRTLKKTFVKNVFLTLCACLLFFVVVPMVVYVLSYIPYYYGTKSLYPIRENIRFLKEHPTLAFLFPNQNIGNFLAAVVQNQLDMFSYHSKLTEPHPYSSEWWKWITDWRPIFYYAGDFKQNVLLTSETKTIKQGISAFGNPLVWWGGIVAFVYLSYQFIQKQSRTIFFLIVAYAAQLLPWLWVSRTTFIYHYFPCVPFLVLAITYMFRDVAFFHGKKACYIYLVAVIVLFLLFYPVLSGMPIDVTFVEGLLKWSFMPKWQLI